MPSWTSTIASLPFSLRIVLGLCLAGLLAHIAVYSFLCDDAFISFRYAKNFAEGYGLVFNPGFERVEGYSNFLWVLILALGRWLGMPPEATASPLSILFSLSLAVWLLWFCERHRPREASPWWLVVPAAFLAANRSYAVWSTGGLETKLFELLVCGGVFCTLDEMKAMREGDVSRFPFSVLLLALATLTRPDGFLIAACVIATRMVLQALDRSFRFRPMAMGAGMYVTLVGGHFLFRQAYYGDWLPNTYYAKVGGAWWDMGGRYLAAFALEYGLVFWLPLVVAGIVSLIRMGRRDIVLVILAAVAPHALYIAAIGGDHFEYRPVDVYVPLLVVLLYFGACGLSRRRVAASGVAAYLVICGAVSLAIPALTHLDAPRDYRPGFPGITPRADHIAEIISSKTHLRLFETWGVGAYLRLYNDVMNEISRHFVGLRQEEHALFFGTVKKQATWLRELVDSGKVPRDLHIAIGCVGAIPYYSGLRTLDRLGLTDREVAHRPIPEGKTRIMAHDKAADPYYAVERGVDLWATNTVHLILPLGHPELFHFAYLARAGRMKHMIIADVGENRFILAFAMQGLDKLKKRCPKLRFMSAEAYLNIEAAACGGRFVPVPREAQLDLPYDITYLVQGEQTMRNFDDLAGARLHLERALATDPTNGDVRDLMEVIDRASKPDASNGRPGGR